MRAGLLGDPAHRGQTCPGDRGRPCWGASCFGGSKQTSRSILNVAPPEPHVAGMEKDVVRFGPHPTLSCQPGGADMQRAGQDSKDREGRHSDQAGTSPGVRPGGGVPRHCGEACSEHTRCQALDEPAGTGLCVAQCPRARVCTHKMCAMDTGA